MSTKCKKDLPQTGWALGNKAIRKPDTTVFPIRLAKSLAGLKGKFLMSLNGHKEVRRIFAGFKVQQVALKYSCMAATAAARAATRSRTPDQQLLL